MAEKSSELGALVPDTGLAILTGPEPMIGRYVRLERLKESDFPALWSSVGAHDDIWTYWPEGPFDKDSFIAMLKDLRADVKLFLYTIFQRGEASGCLILQMTDLGSRVVEIGMVYGPSLQRTREATEALYLLVSLVFDKLNCRRLEWKTDRLNRPSRRAAERYGFVYEGCLRQHRIHKGRNRDTVWYSMLDREWPVCKRAFNALARGCEFRRAGKATKATWRHQAEYEQLAARGSQKEMMCERMIDLLDIQILAKRLWVLK